MSNPIRLNGFETPLDVAVPVTDPPPVISTNSIFHAVAVPFSVHPKSAEKPSILVAVKTPGCEHEGNSVKDTLSIEISPSNVPALVPLNVTEIVYPAYAAKSTIANSQGVVAEACCSPVRDQIFVVPFTKTSRVPI